MMLKHFMHRGDTRMNPSPAASFEPHRRRLAGLAYRMLGSMAEAEDAVQETYLRWHDTDRDRIESPRAFLVTTTTRICLEGGAAACPARELDRGLLPLSTRPAADSESVSGRRGGRGNPRWVIDPALRQIRLQTRRAADGLHAGLAVG